MKVALLPNLDKRGSAETVEKLGVFLKKEGIEAYLPDSICTPNFNYAPEDELYKIADIIITIGGDGTIIRYAKRAALDGKPVLGINAGRMGYLANIEQNELRQLSKLKTGVYFLGEKGKNYLDGDEFAEIIYFYRKEAKERCLKYQEMKSAGVEVEENIKRATKEVTKKI